MKDRLGWAGLGMPVQERPTNFSESERWLSNSDIKGDGKVGEQEEADCLA